MVHGQAAVVLALAAVCERRLEGQGLDLLKGEHGGRDALIVPLPGDQGGTEGAHDAGDIRPDHLAVCDLLEGPQDGVIVEGAALDHDVFAELCGRGDLHDLEQCVLDDGVRKTCRDVGDLCALLLGLLHAAVHEHGTAGAEVDGVLCKECGLGKVLHGVGEGLCKGLDKGPAAGGAGLVQGDGIHRTIFDADALHVLAADVQDAVDVRIKVGGAVVVGDGLHLAVVELEGTL